MPGTTVEEKLTIVHVDKVIDNLVLVSVWGVQNHQFFHHTWVEDVFVQTGKICFFGTKTKFVGFVHLDKFLRITNLLSEKHESGQLANHVCTDRDHIQFRLLVKSRVIHREVNNLLVIDNGCQMSSRQIWLVML